MHAGLDTWYFCDLARNKMYRVTPPPPPPKKKSCARNKMYRVPPPPPAKKKKSCARNKMYRVTPPPQKKTKSCARNKMYRVNPPPKKKNKKKSCCTQRCKESCTVCPGLNVVGGRGGGGTGPAHQYAFMKRVCTKCDG